MQRGAYLILLAIAAIILIAVFSIFYLSGSQKYPAPVLGPNTIELSPNTPITYTSLAILSCALPWISSAIINQTGFSFYNVIIDKNFTVNGYQLQQGKIGKINYRIELVNSLGTPQSTSINNSALILIPTTSIFNSNRPKINLSAAGIKIYFTPGNEILIKNSTGDERLVTITIAVAGNAPSGTYLVAMEPSACPPLFGTFFLTISNGVPQSNYSSPIPS